MDSGTLNHFSAPRNAVGKGGLSAKLWQPLDISVKQVEEGDGLLEKGRWAHPVSTEMKGQFNWRALKTGDTASCRGTGAEI